QPTGTQQPINFGIAEQNKNKFGPQRHNIPSIIRGFKCATTTRIRSMGFHDFAWQERYHDRIIRDEFELNRIREYIINNPSRWRSDRNILD
ncbi:TPA: transposase, partial [Candidatus Uhrbacteria bacterium]|nr:transposase [Candidatus Uhrbacteria bacterium]